MISVQSVVKYLFGSDLITRYCGLRLHASGFPENVAYYLLSFADACRLGVVHLWMSVDEGLLAAVVVWELLLGGFPRMDGLKPREWIA